MRYLVPCSLKSIRSQSHLHSCLLPMLLGANLGGQERGRMEMCGSFIFVHGRFQTDEIHVFSALRLSNATGALECILYLSIHIWYVFLMQVP